MNRKMRRAAGRKNGRRQPDAAENSHTLTLLFAEARRRHRSGQLAEAVAVYDRILSLNSDLSEVHNNRGAALFEMGRVGDAELAYRSAIAANPNSADAHNNLGSTLCSIGRAEAALPAIRVAIKLRPAWPSCHLNLGMALHVLGAFDEAEAAYRHAIVLDPAFAEAHNNLGGLLRQLGRLDEAEQSLRTAIALNPRYADACSNLGNTFLERNKLTEAEAAYRRAIALNPTLADAHNNLGIVLKYLGRLPDARRAVERAVQLAPQNAYYFLGLADLKRFEAEDDPHLKALEDLALNIHALSVDQKIHLHFALAKAYDDIGRCNDAFGQKLAGNALKRRSIIYDEAAQLLTFERTRAVFTPGLVRKHEDCGEPSSLPVFIIGMPRSGSTLIEQILASHPQVFGAGELPNFGNAVKRIESEAGSPFPDAMRCFSSASLREAGQRYVAEIATLAPGAARVTDKSLWNFLYAGLIHLMLPNARIIHAVRDPVDTCLSCFSKHFASGLHHTYNLAELGRHYRHYQALMQHWHGLLPPGRILDVHYERVIADLEGQARRIIAHCGLAWDRRCLAFHETERPVVTASSAQVRRPLYRDAIGRARPSDAYLQPLLAELCGDQGMTCRIVPDAEVSLHDQSSRSLGQPLGSFGDIEPCAD